MKKICLMLLMSLLAIGIVAGQSGADLTKGESTRGTDPTVQSEVAQGGNTTTLNIVQDLISGIWQGFFGNVSGSLSLENGAGNVFYDWSYVNVTGEVLASRFTVDDWSALNCSNSTHWEEEETELNIEATDIDGINETYNATTHPDFDVAGSTMTGCRSTQPYTTGGVPGPFWNVMLNSNSTNTVYTSILASDETAFDGGTADFELLVPVDETTGLATYFFYAELN